MRNYQYKAFGVLFTIPFPIKGLKETQGEPEIIIRFGDTPEKLENVQKKGVLFQVDHEGFLFEFESVARYWAKNNGEVIITRNAGASIDDIIVFLFSSVFAYLLQNMGFLTLHANVVHRNNNAYLIAGNSGAGKSTLTFSLLQNGYSFYSDDIASISFNEVGKPFVAYGLPRLKLWKDALNYFSISKDGLNHIRSQIEKFYYPVNLDYSTYCLPISKMIVLSTHNRDEVLIKKIEGADKFTSLKSNTYRYQFLSKESGIKPHFVLSSQLVSNIDIYRVTRPNFDFKIDALQNEVKKIFGDGQ